MPLTSNFSLSISGSLTKAATLGTPTHNPTLSLAQALASGTGLNAADMLWDDVRTLNATTSENLDLSGTLVNGLGTTVAFARIRAIGIQLVTATAGYTLEVGGAASNQFATMFGTATDKLIIRAGGGVGILAPDATGYVVTAGTGDLLKINNPNAASIQYKIVIIGATA